MAKFYLTDAKTWVDYWDGERFWPVAPEPTTKLLEAIKNHEIAIHWRSERVAEFIIDDPIPDHQV